MAATVKIISWNVRGRNCLFKGGSVRWVCIDIRVMLPSFLNINWKRLTVRFFLVFEVGVR